MTTDYVPIDCDQHSVLELLAMRQAQVMVQRQGVDAGESVQGTVCDVLTRDGAEYLILRDQAGKERAIRLDQLLALYGSGGERLWCQKNVAD